MALKTLMLRKKIDDANKALETLREAEKEFEKREADLEAAINEAETEEEQQACEEEVEKFEADKAEHNERKQGLEKDVADLEAELAAEEERAEKALMPKEGEEKPMEKRNTLDMRSEFTEEELEKREAFANYIKDVCTGNLKRDTDYNLIQGNNGVIVPKTIAQEVITKVKDLCPIFDMGHRYPIKGTLEIPYYPYSADHVINVAYKNEMDELVASSGDFGTIELTGFLAGGLAKISKKLINNTDIDVLPFIIEQLAEGFKAFYEHECLVGTSQKATGLIAGIAGDATVTGQYKSSISADELIEVQDKVPDVYQEKACWIMNKSTRLMVKKLKDGQGNYLLNKDFRTGYGYELLGRPVYISENMPALGTTNNVAVVYGDMSGLGIKLTEDLEIQTLLEKFATQHAVGILGWTEIDTKVENAQKFSAFKCGSSDPQ